MSVLVCVVMVLCGFTHQKLSKKEMGNFRKMMSSFDKKYHTHHHKYSSDLSLTLSGNKEPKMPYGLLADSDGNLFEQKTEEKPLKRKIRRLRLKQHKNKGLNKKFDKYDDMILSKDFNIKFESMSLSNEDGDLHKELSKRLRSQFDNDDFDDDSDFSQLSSKHSPSEVKEDMASSPETLSSIEEGKAKEEKMLEKVLNETGNDSVPSQEIVETEESSPTDNNKIASGLPDNK